MPSAETTYTVGVIREKEKGFLDETDYTRIIEAPSTQEAVHVLVDTPYGIWMNGDNKQNVFDALVSHLQEELIWIIDLLEKPELARFITARYNALDIVNAIHERKTGADNLSKVSPLSSLTLETLHSALWHNQNWDQMPSEWAEWTKHALQDSYQDDWSMHTLLQNAEKRMWEIMEENATTSLAKEIVALHKEHSHLDNALRMNRNESAVEIDVSNAVKEHPYLTKEAIKATQQHTDATQYEKEWDNALLSLIKKYRLEPSGFDPILAYWYGKEMEARQLRILLSAKMGGIPAETLDNLKRVSYTSLS